MLVSEMKERGFSKPSFVGGLFPRKQVTVLASPPGTGKTWLSLAWAFGLSTAGCLVGVPLVTPEAKVVFFCGEAGYDIMAERCSLLTLDHNPKNINIVTLEEEPELSLVTEGGFSRVCQIAKGYDVIFFDTLISFCGVEENSAKEMGDIFRRLRRLATVYNCAVVVNHHLRKVKATDSGNERSLDDVIGSSAISRLSALVLILSRQHEGVKLRCVKTWYKAPADFYFGVANTPDGHVEMVISAMQGVPEDEGKMQIAKLVYATPPNCVLTPGFLSNATGLSPSWIRRVLPELVEDGWLVEKELDGKSKGYMRTEKQ